MGIRFALEEEIYPYLPLHIKGFLLDVNSMIMDKVVEIRLRVQQPLLLVLPDGDICISVNGICGPTAAYFCTKEDIVQTMRAICKNSFYALEEELRQGYVTLAGGHRVGFTGQAVQEGGIIKSFKNFSSLNIRVSREVTNCAANLWDSLFDTQGRLRNTLVISPPRCGKTTLLRDLVRLLSTGTAEVRGMQVGVVDERSEIAACKNGVMTSRLGHRVDVLDGCPKAIGMLMLIRSMAPQVIVTDEIGRREDVIALEEALHAGVRVIASAHGSGIEDLKRRPYVNKLLRSGYFGCYVVLSDIPKVGTIRQVVLNEAQ